MGVWLGCSGVFLPTPPRGGRPEWFELLTELGDVSTHAPTRRATASSEISAVLKSVSTHAPTRRATIRALREEVAGLFLPTPPRGGRRSAGSALKSWKKFLPTPPRGGRLPIGKPHDRWLKFLPTPPRGGRPDKLALQCPALEFLPTPPRGGRQPSMAATLVARAFLPTPPRGGRHRGRTLLPSPICFYPRPHAEGDCLCLSRLFEQRNSRLWCERVFWEGLIEGLPVMGYENLNYFRYLPYVRTSRLCAARLGFAHRRCWTCG